MQPIHYHQQQPSSPASAKPLLLAIAAIFVLVGIFVLKSDKKDDGDGTTSATTTSQDGSNLEVPTIQPEEVYKLITNKGYQMIDIREKTLYEQSHIESSTNVPFSTISSNAKAFDKSKKIIIIDTKNTAEGKILTDHLIKEGLEVKYMEGGIEKYYMRSLPLISYGNTESIRDKSKGTPLSATEVSQRADKGERFKFIDVRPATEFEKSHIEGAINIPLEEIEQRKDDVPSGKIITVDETPVRSFQAAVKLYDMNFWGVFYLSDSLSTLKAVVNGEAQTAPSGQAGPSGMNGQTNDPGTNSPSIQPNGDAGPTVPASSPATNTPPQQ